MKNPYHQNRRKHFQVLPGAKDAKSPPLPYSSMSKGVSIVPGFDGFFIPSDQLSCYEPAPKNSELSCQDRKPLTELDQQ